MLEGESEVGSHGVTSRVEVERQQSDTDERNRAANAPEHSIDQGHSSMNVALPDLPGSDELPSPEYLRVLYTTMEELPKWERLQRRQLKRKLGKEEFIRRDQRGEFKILTVLGLEKLFPDNLLPEFSERIQKIQSKT